MSTLRTFVAIPVADAPRQTIAAWQRQLSVRLSGIKWVEEENLHLTLKFLGETRPADVGRVREALAHAADRCAAFAVAFRGAGAFPSPGAPRVLWVGVKEDGGLARLHRQVEEALAGLGWEGERGPFRPHLTVGRVRRPAARPDVAAALAGVAEQAWGEIWVTGFHFMESTLTPRGPIYRSLAHFPLARGTANG